MAQEAFTTIFNPVNGLPWECPNTEDALAYWVGEKKFTKTANKNTPKGDKEESA